MYFGPPQEEFLFLGRVEAKEREVKIFQKIGIIMGSVESGWGDCFKNIMCDEWVNFFFSLNILAGGGEFFSTSWEEGK